jgi:hypothetical protein
MVWVILAALGVPIWLCAAAILTLIFRNRALRTRPGNVPVRVRRPGKRRWVRGHAVWVHDVFAFRGSPAAWKEELIWVSEAALRAPSDDERDGWRQLGDDPVIAVLEAAEAADQSIEVAARAEHRGQLCGPFMAQAHGLATARGES